MTKINKLSFKVLGIFLLVAFLVTSGFGCKVQTSEQADAMKPITLNYWRVNDDQDAFDEIIKDYQVIHPNITIKYRKFRSDEFETELLNALAEDRGPDIFSIPEQWLLEYQNKLAPLPAEIKIGYIVEKTYLSIKKEKVVEIRTEKTPSLRVLKDTYADTVSSDAVIGGQIYGLPLSLETLIMFYNKSIMSQSGISQIPTDWQSFQDAVKKSTKFESGDKILQAGAALGTGFNVQHSFDILSILMMQNGAKMANETTGMPSFFSRITIGSQTLTPGLTALQFYTDFANKTKVVYSWNTAMSDSLASFMAGQVGFFFGYNYNIAQIRGQSKVNFGVASIPQIPGSITKNYANYWLEVVSKKSKYTNESWDFLLFANKQAEIKKFLAKTNRPTAQKALIDSQIDNEDLHPSVAQVLTAGTWYKGRNFDAAYQAIQEMIEQYLILTDERQINNIISIATQRVAQTINPSN